MQAEQENTTKARRRAYAAARSTCQRSFDTKKTKKYLCKKAKSPNKENVDE